MKTAFGHILIQGKDREGDQTANPETGGESQQRAHQKARSEAECSELSTWDRKFCSGRTNDLRL